MVGESVVSTAIEIVVAESVVRVVTYIDATITILINFLKDFTDERLQCTAKSERHASESSSLRGDMHRSAPRHHQH